MALVQEDIEQIEELIRKSIAATPELGNANVRYELELYEKTARIEEKLKHQRELREMEVNNHPISLAFLSLFKSSQSLRRTTMLLLRILKQK